MNLHFLLLFIVMLSCLTASAQEKELHVKVVERTYRKVVDSSEVALYLVSGENFIPVALRISDVKGLVTFTIHPDSSYKINANKMGYYPAVENMYAYKKDTFTLLIDKAHPPKFRPQDIYFEFGIDTLIDFYKVTLDTILFYYIPVLRNNPTYKLVVCGHTDGLEYKKFSKNLSRNRARSIKAYLISHGVKASRIEVQAKANEMPDWIETKAGADDPEARERNRRVEIRIYVPTPESYPDIEYVPARPAAVSTHSR